LFAIAFKPETTGFFPYVFCSLYESRRMILDLYQGRGFFIKKFMESNLITGRNPGTISVKLTKTVEFEKKWFEMMNRSRLRWVGKFGLNLFTKTTYSPLY